MSPYLPRVGPLLITFFSLLPIILWLRLVSPTHAFSNLVGLSLSLGQLLGLVGSVLLSINFILSGRFKFLEPYFGGMNRMYIVHHITGGISFILLLLHPVMLAYAYHPVALPPASTLFLPITTNPAVTFGILSLLILTILLVITFFIPFPYHIWKKTHQWLGLALLLAALHAYAIPSHVSTDPLLRYYVLSFCLAGLAVFTYRTLFGKFLVHRYPYRVESVKVLNNTVTEITLSPLGRSLSYRPGQFIFLHFDSLQVSREQHPFSITSSPSNSRLTVSAKVSGDYTTALGSLNPGDTAKVEGAFGAFRALDYSNPDQVWIAGGIGITPFLSLIKSLPRTPKLDIRLYYAVSEKPEAVYLDFLKQNSPKNQVQVIPRFTKAEGHLTATAVADAVPDLAKRDIFICGPHPMMTSLRAQFRALGIKNSHIHSEEFSLQ